MLRETRNIFSVLNGDILIQYIDPNNLVTGYRFGNISTISVVPNSIYEIDSLQIVSAFQRINSTTSTASSRQSAGVLFSLSNSVAINENIFFDLPFPDTIPVSGGYEIRESDVISGFSSVEPSTTIISTKNPAGAGVRFPSIYPKIGQSMLRVIPLSSSNGVNTVESTVQNTIEFSNIKFRSFNYRYLLIGLIGVFNRELFTSGSGDYNFTSVSTIGFNLKRYSLRK